MSTELNAPRVDARRSDRVLASIMIVIALGALWFSRDMSIMASIFPRTIATLLLIFSVALLVRAFIARPQMPKPQPGSVGRRLGLVGVMLAWSFSLKWLGFIAASTLAAVALSLLAHYHGWTFKRAMAYGLVLAGIIAFFYTLFAILLNVPLPVGLLWRDL
ncbi:Tripartite tricarboxylate transporter TctB family protein [Modicisalibacter ilicicola DSM 19980]|uniref:Tripartite tricarboxylate transporter TctB family protein n=1 Tax=Modicisalibacter ilicicola DSM 19980 TaxID=1121942 RepID=A0A1M4TI91_9GAMM|nr:tripartite tricarboxylate transporter TctB family protein [Halomonas ilicicola]SHE44222.1 Tripartite tricarboxylate transporter TctB family protein [Halomonas ilicicola DSM 19980]